MTEPSREILDHEVQLNYEPAAPPSLGWHEVVFIWLAYFVLSFVSATLLEIALSMKNYGRLWGTGVVFIIGIVGSCVIAITLPFSPIPFRCVFHRALLGAAAVAIVAPWLAIVFVELCCRLA
jgi:hypothetical protein